jgi:hypothetical protein
MANIYSSKVKILESSDFDTDQENLITVKYNDCMLILFYIQNDESLKLAQIFAEAANSLPAPIFAACNLNNSTKVASAFAKLASDGNHILHNYGLKQYPFIITYRNKNPVGFYNSGRSVQSISDFAVSSACSVEYREDIQYGMGVAVDKNSQMSAYEIQQTKYLKSTDYKGDEGIRKYSNKIPIVVSGTKEAEKATEQEVKNEQQQPVQEPTPQTTPVQPIPQPSTA